MYNYFNRLPGQFSTNDGTIDFYLRIRTLIDKKTVALDLGGGRGDWYNSKTNIKLRKSIQFLKKDVKQLIVVDVDPAVLKNKTSHKNLLIKNGIIPLKDNSIDLIICDWVFEHIENTQKFYLEINRVLKKNGSICSRTPHKYNYFSIISNLLEGSSLKGWILKKSQPGRKKYFKSFYNLNTKNKIKRTFFNYSNNMFIFIPDPAYYFNSKLIFLFFRFVHIILPSFFSGILISFSKKIK